MRLLAWHVHGSWMTSFVAGPHTYLVPVLPDRGPDGRGRARTYPWGANVVEVTPEQLRSEELDAVVLQRPHELDLVRQWTGRTPGVDLPAVYVEHNTPRGDVTAWGHPLAGQDAIPVVHVTAWNAAMYDNGRAPVVVVEHGVPDPGYLFTERRSLGVVVNEPVRRHLVAGMDHAAAVAAHVPIEVYGIGVSDLPAHWPGPGLDAVHEDLPQSALHPRLGTHRAYLHPYRWTSLGLALIEAMTIGLPVIVLAATAVPESLTDEVGCVSSDRRRLVEAARRFAADADLARETGLLARRHALDRFGLDRFLGDWNALLKEVTR